MTKQKHSIINVAIIDENGRIIEHDTLETIRDIYAADAYDYTADDTKTLESYYDEEEGDYLKRAAAELAKQRATIVWDPHSELAFMHADAFEWWAHYLLHVNRLAVVDQTIYRGNPSDEDIKLYDTLAEAAEAARDTWSRKTPYDQGRARVFVAADMEDMHGGYDILDADRGGFDSEVDA